MGTALSCSGTTPRSDDPSSSALLPTTAASAGLTPATHSTKTTSPERKKDGRLVVTVAEGVLYGGTKLPIIGDFMQVLKDALEKCEEVSDLISEAKDLVELIEDLLWVLEDLDECLNENDRAMKIVTRTKAALVEVVGVAKKISIGSPRGRFLRGASHAKPFQNAKDKMNNALRMLPIVLQAMNLSDKREDKRRTAKMAKDTLDGCKQEVHENVKRAAASLAKGKVSEAERILDGIPDDVRISAMELFVRGSIFIAQDKYVDAVEVLDEAVNKASDLAAAWFALGQAYCFLERYADAASPSQRAVELFKANETTIEYANALSLLGVVSRHRHDYSAAEAHLRCSLALYENLGDAPATAIGLNNLAILFKDQVLSRLFFCNDCHLRANSMMLGISTSAQLQLTKRPLDKTIPSLRVDSTTSPSSSRSRYLFSSDSTHTDVARTTGQVRRSENALHTRHRH